MYDPMHATGFTVIELMVTVAISLLLLAIAQPSFDGMRQRAALRGAAENAIAFWSEARFEAAKRNQMVKIGVMQSGDSFCIGAATTSNPADTTPCDCISESPALNACDVASFPTDQSDWNGVQLAGVTLGGAATIANAQPAVIDPKRTQLLVPSDDGTVSLSTSSGRLEYRLNMHVNRFGRAALCESTSSIDHLSDFNSRRCTD